MLRRHRGLAVVGLLAGVLLVWVGTASAAVDETGPAIAAAARLEDSTVDEINRVRQARGLRPLEASPRLEEAARAHALSMAETGFFDHASADGTPFWRRIARSYPSRGFRRWSVAENLLWAASGISPRRAVRLWLASPEHREVLLTPGFRQVGLAAVSVTAAPGIFAGLDISVIAADFGVRSRTVR